MRVRPVAININGDVLSKKRVLTSQRFRRVIAKSYLPIDFSWHSKDWINGRKANKNDEFNKIKKLTEISTWYMCIMFFFLQYKITQIKTEQRCCRMRWFFFGFSTIIKTICFFNSHFTRISLQIKCEKIAKQIIQEMFIWMNEFRNLNLKLFHLC